MPPSGPPVGLTQASLPARPTGRNYRTPRRIGPPDGRATEAGFDRSLTKPPELAGLVETARRPGQTQRSQGLA